MGVQIHLLSPINSSVYHNTERATLSKQQWQFHKWKFNDRLENTHTADPAGTNEKCFQGEKCEVQNVILFVES